MRMGRVVIPWLVDGAAMVVVEEWDDDVWDNPEMWTSKKRSDGFIKWIPQMPRLPKETQEAPDN